MNARNSIARLIIGVVAGVVVAGIPVAAATAGSASAAVHCGRPDAHRVVHCSNGDRQFVDRRGHLVTINRLGVIVRDLAPGRAWY